MTALAHDIETAPSSRVASGFGFAALSAMAFGLSGSLAKGLLDAGWTAGAAVTVRVLLAAAVLLIPAAVSLRGQWNRLRDNAGLIVAYGVIGVAGCQLAYFNAVDHMDVGVALLIEFTCPVVVVGWMWFRHEQRPGRLTVIGGSLAAGGLVLVLNLLSGADIDGIGIVWALGAMIGAAVYWVISADDDTGLPPLALAAGGLLCGGVILLIAGLVGVVPFAATRADVTFAHATVPWWVPIVGLGVVTAALAYVLGIAASRRLGSRLASFVGLAEVLTALVFAWLLLDQSPSPVQLGGGALILLGVIVVKLGERQVRQEDFSTGSQISTV
ncbi:EamA family transporter [Antrihabitans cavernicola]|uniref:EamA family transporter n=1 Tax=Antrihabitans cavernicola TaxID=2495913 RepID=A0A5A7SDI1_9NOCA|nr:DMT family transporter [Spelaeibacter cavernicola]KAA0023439.1 EamA family transporter [Spelaeibacter cavernicola]